MVDFIEILDIKAPINISSLDLSQNDIFLGNIEDEEGYIIGEEDELYNRLLMVK